VIHIFLAKAEIIRYEFFSGMFCQNIRRDNGIALFSGGTKGAMWVKEIEVKVLTMTSKRQCAF